MCLFGASYTICILASFESWCSFTHGRCAWCGAKDLPPSLNHHHFCESSHSSVSSYMKSILGQVPWFTCVRCYDSDNPFNIVHWPIATGNIPRVSPTLETVRVNQNTILLVIIHLEIPSSKQLYSSCVRSNFVCKVSFHSCRPAPINSSGPCSNPFSCSSHVAAVCPHFAHWRPGGCPPSWIEGQDPVKHEYAATARSSSNVGVGQIRWSPFGTTLANKFLPCIFFPCTGMPLV